MRKRIFKIIGIAGAFLLALFVCFYVFSLYMFSNEPGPDYPTNIWSFHDTGHSKIDPLTILESLDRGEKDIFQLESGIPENPKLIIPIEWTQAEFIEVALALHQTVWKESWDGWNLYRINFFTPCKDNPKGFSKAEFYFYKDAMVNDRKRYSVRVIHLNPQYGYVAWGSDPEFPHPQFGRWKIIDLDKLIVPAEEALNKAEANGGKDYRLVEENDCSIHVYMNPEVYDRNDWWVSYGGKKEFWIHPK